MGCEFGLGQIPANGIYTERTATKKTGTFTFDFSLIGHGSL